MSLVLAGVINMAYEIFAWMLILSFGLEDIPYDVFPHVLLYCPYSDVTGISISAAVACFLPPSVWGAAFWFSPWQVYRLRPLRKPFARAHAIHWSGSVLRRRFLPLFFSRVSHCVWFWFLKGNTFQLFLPECTNSWLAATKRFVVGGRPFVAFPALGFCLLCKTSMNSNRPGDRNLSSWSMGVCIYSCELADLLLAQQVATTVWQYKVR